MREIAKILVAIVLFVIAYKDWRTKKIPYFLILLLGITTVFLRILVAGDTIWSTMAGVGFGVFFFLLSKYSRESVGYGDSWIILLLGVFVGGKAALEIVLAAMFLASLFSIVCCIKKGWRKNYRIPFIPFLAATYMAVMFL